MLSFSIIENILMCLSYVGLIINYLFLITIIKLILNCKFKSTRIKFADLNQKLTAHLLIL